MKKHTIDAFFMFLITSFFLWLTIQYSRITIADNVLFLTQLHAPQILRIKTPQKTLVFEDDATIQQVHSLLIQKMAIKVSDEEIDKFNKTEILSMDYDYKGNYMIVGEDGKILLSIYKSDVKNRSRLHWLWHRYDEKYGDDKSTITYMTDIDKKVEEVLNTIIKNSEENKK